ncbi:hypothetical protein BN1086_04926 [Citrobacter koseri]|uniref:Uncharacterized protein n=1 Tax=Citrobacter koseri TaxID=545 RepID=A0A078LQM6_CITKO|nr:hypothetical protein BN1086_04926 [Citrobacter koseri]
MQNKNSIVIMRRQIRLINAVIHSQQVSFSKI